jgi:hypothetical protein
MPRKRLKDRPEYQAPTAPSCVTDNRIGPNFGRCQRLREEPSHVCPPPAPTLLPEGQPSPPEPPHAQPEPEPEPRAEDPSGVASLPPGRLDLTDPVPPGVSGKRDALGFPTDAQPHITADQLRWLTYRLESGDNQEACERAETDPLTVLEWMADPDFFFIFKSALENKREAAKTLTSHLLPSTLRTLQDILATGSHKDKLAAATLVTRLQGLLVDRVSSAGQGTITDLFRLLREEKVVQPQIIDMTSYKSLPPPPGD